MKTKNRYDTKKKSGYAKIYHKFFNRITVLVLISVLLTETVAAQDLFASGEYMVYAETTENKGNRTDEEKDITDTGSVIGEGYGVTGSDNAPTVDGVLPGAGSTDTAEAYEPMNPPGIPGVPGISEDTEAPSAPGNVTAVVSGSAIFLSWDASKDNTGVRGYRIFRDTEEIGTSEETSYTDTSCTEGNTYTYSVKAYDAAGNLSEAGISMPITAVAQEKAVSLNKPEDLTAMMSDGDVILKWREVTGADSYELSINGDITDVGNTTSYVHTDALTELSYEYKVRAKNGTGVSEWSDAAVLTAGPGKVSNLSVVTVDTLTMELSWNPEEGASSYEIECNGIILAAVTDSSYTHILNAPATVLIYRVRAVSGELKGAWSDAYSASVQIIIPGGTLTGNTVWDGTAGIYLIQGDITIAAGATLRIMPGTIVIFEPACGMTVNGNLTAEGTEGQPVIITSARDPEYGGSGIEEIEDYWNRIYVEDTGVFTGNYVRIGYGGYNGYYGGSILEVIGNLNLNYSGIFNSLSNGILVYSAFDIVVQNSVIENSAGSGIHINKWINPTGTVTIKNNIIQNNSGGGISVNLARGDGLFIENNMIRGNAGYGIYLSQNVSNLSIIGNDILNNGNFPIHTSLGWIEFESELDALWNNNISGNSPADLIALDGEIYTDLTLKNGYVIENSVYVWDDITLTIQPGTVLPATNYGAITVYGRMIAEGTEENPIVFTSLMDPEYGGSGVNGQEDGWWGISVTWIGEFTGNYIWVKYSSDCAFDVSGKFYLDNSRISDSFGDGITIYSNNDVTIQNSIIESSQSSGIGIGDNIVFPTFSRTADFRDGIMQPSDSEEDYGTITIRNNILRNSSYSGIFICQPEYNRVVIENNTIENNGDFPVRVNLGGTWSSEALSHMSGNIFRGNHVSERIGLSVGYYYWYANHVYKDITLPRNEHKYEAVGKIPIASGATLTIQPGVIILMNSQSSTGIEVKGRLVAEGTVQEPVVFTPTDDPEYGDNMAIKSEAGSKWEGIHVTSSGEFTGSHTVIRNGGYRITGEYGALYAEGRLNLFYCEITDSYGYGIYFNTGEQPVLFYNTFTDNPYAVYNANSDTEINASWNYWNSIYGPSVYRQVYDPYQGTWSPEWTGNGEKIYGEIDYSPYLGFDMTGPVHFGKSEGTYAPTGNYSRLFTDLSLNSSDEELTFTRLYNSQNTEETGIFGKGWSFNYESDIREHELFSHIRIVTLPDGSQESYTLNTDGSYTANSSRNTLAKQTDGSYVLTTKEQVKYGFNPDGILSRIESREGNRLDIRLTPEGKPQSITDYAGREYRFAYEGGLLKTITDPAGRTVNYAYTGGRLVKVTGPDGITTHYGYDADGYLSEIRDGNNDRTEAVAYRISDGIAQVERVTDAYGNVKTYTYDEVSGKTTITDSNGNTTTQWYDTTYNITYTTDAEGRLRAEAYTTEDGVNKYGEVKSVTDRNGNTTAYEYDGRGNITKITNPDSSYRLYTYDGKNNIISEREEAGKYTYYIYDAAETLLLKLVRPLNGTDAYSGAADQNRFAITGYTYYALGEGGHTIRGLVKTVTDPEGNTTAYTYDTYGNAATVTDPEGSITTNTNNILGLPTVILSPKEERTTITYNDNGNPVRIVRHGGETTQIIYDSLGRITQEITPNLSEIIDGPAGREGYRYTYYPSGSLHTVTDPENNITAYTYDIYGNLLTETRPDGSILSYEYDVLNRVTREYFQDSSTTERSLQKSYAYAILSNGNTQTTETVFLNETETAVTVIVYDYAGRQIKQTNPDGGILTIVYDANGTIYSQTDAMGSTAYYRYDGLNRLTQQWKPFDWNPFDENQYTYQAYTYDKNGNRTEEKTGVTPVPLWTVPEDLITTSYTYDGMNRVQSITGPEGGRTEYEYDANGSLSRELIYLDGSKTKETRYEYNHLDKPEKIIQYAAAGDIHGNAVDSTAELHLETAYTYDANGNILTMTTPDGTRTVYEYDKLDRPITQTVQGLDEYGHPAAIVTSTTYDYAGNILSITDANGNITGNTYNKKGLLIKQADAEGGTRVYDYDNAGRLTAAVAPENYKEGTALTGMSRAVYIYDTMGRVILEQDIYYDKAAGAWNTIHAKAYQYDWNGNIIKELDALGYESGTGSTITDRINTGYGTENTYNDAGLLLTTLSPASEEKGLEYDIRYTYDAAGRKTSETNAKGVVTSYAYDNAGRLTKTTVTDTTDKMIGQTAYDAMGNIVTQTDGNGNTTTYTYNRLGLVKSRTTPGDASIPSDTAVYQYDEMGRQVYQKDSQGREVIITYNHNGQILTQTEQKEDGTQSITVSNAYDRNGNLRFATDANGVTTEQEYDGLNRVVQTSLTVGGTEQITAYTYDKNGNQLTATDWLGNTDTKEYDALNRLMKETDPYGNVIEQYEYNNNHAQVKATDALGNVTSYAYDRNNRLIRTTDPEGNITSQTYDHVGNMATMTDGNGNVTAYEYDVLNRLTKVTNARGESTAYIYDINGNMLTKTDGRGNTVAYTYNAANLLLTETDAGGAKDSYTYYADGQVKRKTDKNGSIVTYTYDVHGNLLAEAADGSGSMGNLEYTYTYDANGNMLTMTDGEGTTLRTYDELGRALTKTVPGIGTVSYTYDIRTGAEEGRHQEKTTDPKGNITIKEYDKAGRLSKVTAGADTVAYTYYDNGSRESVTYNDGTREEYTYNANSQIETLVNRKADGSILDSYAYTYDNVGNQLTKHEVIGGVEKGTTAYTYDGLNRLLTVTEPAGRSTAYEYDEAGNRRKETVVTGDTVSGSTITSVSTYTYDNRNRLTEITTRVDNILTKTTGYTYDNNGNQLISTETIVSTVTTTVNTYGVYNQLIRTTTGDGTVINNTYNAEGYRTGKEVNGEKTSYLYENDKVILEVDENGNQKAWNIYGTNLLIRVTGTDAYHYLYNGHADVTALITRDGIIAATYYYDAFGNILESTENADNSIRYAGYQYDEETGLYYVNARMYDPITARFLQEDTYKGDPKDPLSLNLYTYCHNNPVKYTDPSGHRVMYLDDGGGTIKKANSNYVKPVGTNLIARYKAMKDREYIESVIKEYEEKQKSLKVIERTGNDNVYAQVSTDKNRLPDKQQKANAEYIYDHLFEKGWSMEAISGLLGNIQQESWFNPGVWQNLNDTTLGYA